MRMFGCAWKINFPKPCVLIALTRKLVSVKIFTSNHFRTHTQREREREKREPISCLWLHRRTQSPNHATNPIAQIMPLTSSNYEPIYKPTNRSSTQSLWPISLWLRRRPRAFAPRTHESISVCVWFWFFVWFWSTHEPIYISVWFWFFTFSLWSLIFLLLLWWCG